MKPRARPPSTLLSSPSNPSFVPNSNAHYQLLLSLSLTSSTNYLSSCICARKQSAMPVKFRTKPPSSRMYTFFPPDYPTRGGGGGVSTAANMFATRPISDLMGPCGRVTPVHGSLPRGDRAPLSLHPLRGINWPWPLSPPWL